MIVLRSRQAMSCQVTKSRWASPRVTPRHPFSILTVYGFINLSLNINVFSSTACQVMKRLCCKQSLLVAAKTGVASIAPESAPDRMAFVLSKGFYPLECTFKQHSGKQRISRTSQVIGLRLIGLRRSCPHYQLL